MPLPVENVTTRGQPQDTHYIDMGYYDMANDLPSLHEHRDHVINDYAGAALDVPAQAQAAPPVPVSLSSLFHIHISNQTLRRRRSTYLTTQL